jgi:hypothetical protein
MASARHKADRCVSTSEVGLTSNTAAPQLMLTPLLPQRQGPRERPTHVLVRRASRQQGRQHLAGCVGVQKVAATSQVQVLRRRQRGRWQAARAAAAQHNEQQPTCCCVCDSKHPAPLPRPAPLTSAAASPAAAAGWPLSVTAASTSSPSFLRVCSVASDGWGWCAEP